MTTLTTTKNGSVLAAKLALATASLFALLVTLLHVIEPEFHPMWRFVSEYANGPFGWVMKLAFMVLAISCVATAVAIRRQVTTKPGKVGVALLFITAIGLVLAGLNNQDSITSTAVTSEGNLHAVATMIGIPGFSIASLLVGLSLARNNKAWTSIRIKLLILSNASWISFIAMMGYMAVAMPMAGGFGPDVWVGLINRIFLVAMTLWLIIVTSYTLKTKS